MSELSWIVGHPFGVQKVGEFVGVMKKPTHLVSDMLWIKTVYSIPHYNVSIALLSNRCGELFLLFKIFQMEKRTLGQKIIIKSYF